MGTCQRFRHVVSPLFSNVKGPEAFVTNHQANSIIVAVERNLSMEKIVGIMAATSDLETVGNKLYLHCTGTEPYYRIPVPVSFINCVIVAFHDEQQDKLT